MNDDIKTLTGTITGRNKSKNPTLDYIDATKLLQLQKGTLMKYKNILNDYFKLINYQIGQGQAQRGHGIYFYNSPQELLNRLELLGGSLAAGNNGVLPEYIQIAHQLRNIGVVSNNQLNKLLRKYVTIQQMNEARFIFPLLNENK